MYKLYLLRLQIHVFASAFNYFRRTYISYQQLLNV